MRAASEDEVWLALAAPGPWPVSLTVDDTWRPLSDLADPEVRDDVSGHISKRLGGCLERVAWSTLLIGLGARLWGATLPAMVRSNVLVDPEGLVFRDDRGALQLGLQKASGWHDPAPEDLHTAVTAVLQPIVESIPLAPRLLWGNVASALYAAPRVLELPEATSRVERVLDLPPYKGEMVGSRRSTCCLFYLVPGAGLCGDCVLDRVPSASAP